MKIADLVCGAGGTSTGILKACDDLGRRVDLLAVNHWTKAIDTHSLNHPEVRHLCESLENFTPTRVIPGGHLHLLAASPECTHHSNAAGLKKFSGQNAEPFLVMLYGTNNARSVDRPAPTVTANGGHVALAEPFIINLSHGQSDSMQSADAPLATITTAKGGELAICEPFITHLTHHGQRKQHSVDEPFPTVTGAHRGELGLVEPFIVKFHGDHSGRQDSAQRVHKTDKPLPTLDTSNRFGLCEPFIVKYYSSGTAVPVSEPLETVTSRDRFMLIEPKSGRAVAELDILFRMLQPNELAAAMSFPKGYQFSGNREDQVKQIGNAVPVELARAHARELLS